ncbi:prohibitin family protein [Haloarchaeobius amylolyticus]|uniref:prohibitin family protein n=1 Tax=Haloarchaeobius amylolyticus TaxID=1198296 RepID=UPI00226EB49D|nr:prohibitin family protein [Haloarchaeobius amylolyticus]
MSSDDFDIDLGGGSGSSDSGGGGGRRGLVVAAAGLTLLVLVVVLVAFVFGGIVTVDEGTRAVHTSQGKVVGVYGPGWHVKLPVIDGAHHFDVRTQEYTMSSSSGEGVKSNRDDSITALSSEGMELDIDVTVRYHVVPNEVDAIYSTVGTSNEEINRKIVRPTARSAVRSCAAEYEGLQIYSTDRDRFRTCINSQLSAEFEANGVALETVQIRNVQLPPKVVEAINEKQATEKRLEKKETEIEIEKKEKERAVIEAEAEAEQIRIKGEALRDNPEILQLRYIDAIRSNPNTVYIPSDSGLTLTREVDSPNGNANATNNSSRVVAGPAAAVDPSLFAAVGVDPPRVAPV